MALFEKGEMAGGATGLSVGLLLNPGELRAVLLQHDHVRRRGTARLALVRSLTRGLFFLPLAAELAQSCEPVMAAALAGSWPLF